MSLKRTHTFEVNGQSFTVKRPGLPGLQRYFASRARLVTDAGIEGSGFYRNDFEKGLQALALVPEYIKDCPDSWKMKDEKGKPLPRPDGRPALDLDEIPPLELMDVYEEVASFHEKFRDENARLGYQPSEGDAG